MHTIRECDKRLHSLPNWDPNHCKPDEFICACGRRWVHVCDEAEGCFYTEEPLQLGGGKREGQ